MTDTFLDKYLKRSGHSAPATVAPGAATPRSISSGSPRHEPEVAASVSDAGVSAANGTSVAGAASHASRTESTSGANIATAARTALEVGQANTAGAAGDSDPDNTADAAEDLGCFGYLRGVRERAIMLELRKKDGRILAVGYAWLEKIEYDPDHGITLHLPGQHIRITGSGLNAEVRPNVRLFQGILRHRVPWVREVEHPAEIRAAHQLTAIEALHWIT